MSVSDTNKPDDLCPFQEQCGLVELLREKMPELSQRIYNNYCTNTSSPCARRQLYQRAGLHSAPALMLPGQFNWARQIAEELKDIRPVSERAEM